MATKIKEAEEDGEEGGKSFDVSPPLASLLLLILCCHHKTPGFILSSFLPPTLKSDSI